MFTPLGINNNTHAATDYFLDIPLKQTTHYGIYSVTSTASVTLD